MAENSSCCRATCEYPAPAARRPRRAARTWPAVSRTSRRKETLPTRNGTCAVLISVGSYSSWNRPSASCRTSDDLPAMRGARVSGELQGSCKPQRIGGAAAAGRRRRRRARRRRGACCTGGEEPSRGGGCGAAAGRAAYRRPETQEELFFCGLPPPWSRNNMGSPASGAGVTATQPTFAGLRSPTPSSKCEARAPTVPLYYLKLHTGRGSCAPASASRVCASQVEEDKRARSRLRRPCCRPSGGDKRVLAHDDANELE